MEKAVSERLKKFISSKGISIRAFERSCNLSNGYVNGIETTIMPNKLATIRLQYPELNTEWLLYGEGEMLKCEETPTSTTPAEISDYRLVPMYNLDARAGFADNLEWSTEYVVDYIPFKGAKSDDICIPISGDSMSPTYRAGSIVLLHRVDDWADFLELGQVYVIELRDGRRLLKELRRSEFDSKSHYLCVSHNPMFEPVELPKKLIVRVYLVRAVYAKTSM